MEQRRLQMNPPLGADTGPSRCRPQHRQLLQRLTRQRLPRQRLRQLLPRRP